MILFKYLRLLIIGLMVGIVTYVISNGRLQFSEIVIIAMTAMMTVAIFDAFKVMYIRESFSGKQILPPGGLRSEILPLAMKEPQTLSNDDCHKINTYLDVNPIEKVNDKYLSSIYKYCLNKINNNGEISMNKKKVKFNNRVQTISDDGDIDSQSLKSSIISIQ